MTNILPNAILRKKRFGGELNEAEIRAFVRGVTDGSWADYQTSALLMAICIHGMSDRETLALTLAMAKSGDTLNLKDIPGVKAAHVGCLNVVDILNCDKFIISQDAVKKVESIYSMQEEAE